MIFPMKNLSVNVSCPIPQKVPEPENVDEQICQICVKGKKNVFRINPLIELKERRLLHSIQRGEVELGLFNLKFTFQCFITYPTVQCGYQGVMCLCTLTLYYGISVPHGINVPLRQIGKNNKRAPWNRHASRPKIKNIIVILARFHKKKAKICNLHMHLLSI